jgi:hypothetical protein
MTPEWRLKSRFTQDHVYVYHYEELSDLHLQ